MVWISIEKIREFQELADLYSVRERERLAKAELAAKERAKK